MNRVAITVKDERGAPIVGVGVTFLPLAIGGGATDAFPVVPGGVTGYDGTFTRILYFTGSSSWLYTARTEMPGFSVGEAQISLTADGNTAALITLSPAPFSLDVVTKGVPALVSVGSPPDVSFSGLPYFPYAYVETVVTPTGGDPSSNVAPITPDGRCTVSLSDLFRIDPLPTLVGNEAEVLADKALRLDHAVMSTYVSGNIRRLIAEWQTTALLIDAEDPAALFGQWLPAASLSVQRGAYADAMLLLSAGTYQINRSTDAGAMFSITAVSDGKTPLRVRVPAVDLPAKSVTMYAVQMGTRRSNDLTIQIR